MTRTLAASCALVGALQFLATITSAAPSAAASCRFSLSGV